MSSTSRKTQSIQSSYLLLLILLPRDYFNHGGLSSHYVLLVDSILSPSPSSLTICCVYYSYIWPDVFTLWGTNHTAAAMNQAGSILPSEHWGHAGSPTSFLLRCQVPQVYWPLSATSAPLLRTQKTFSPLPHYFRDEETW